MIEYTPTTEEVETHWADVGFAGDRGSFRRWLEWNDVVLLGKVEEALMALGDARSDMAGQERDRSIESKAAGEGKKAELAMSHAWGLRQEAAGIWAAAHVVRDFPVSAQEPNKKEVSK